MASEILEGLISPNNTKIIFFIIDGLGGLAMEGKGGSELEVANIPNLDKLAAQSACGLLDPVGPGISPGSGPAHLALFGYDPIKYSIGRGILSALGIDFELKPGDVAARANFATMDKEGRIVDRRAGRISDSINQRLCKKLREGITWESDIQWFFEPEKEHRAAFILRGQGLSSEISDTDPQKTPYPPKEPKALVPQADQTVRLVKNFLAQAQKVLQDEEKANMILLRGFAQYHPLPSMETKFGLKSLAIANYPMYRGLARLVGMDLLPPCPDMASEISLLAETYHKDYDFFFVHIKEADTKGEDGDFEGKVKVLEEIDRLIPQVIALKPEVLVITGDHSTPSVLTAHSWHPVPVILYSRYSRVDRVDKFDEISCRAGSLGQQPMINLIPLALAHSQKLIKYGA
jgi:2,3-bisphosphoglycerate-independent phosphoglycerate mutase